MTKNLVFLTKKFDFQPQCRFDCQNFDFWRKFQKSPNFCTKFDPLNYFSVRLHIISKPRNVKICEHSICFNYWTKIYLIRHWKFVFFVDIVIFNRFLIIFKFHSQYFIYKIILTIIKKISNTCRFLNSYAFKSYEARRLKKKISFIEKFGPIKKIVSETFWEKLGTPYLCILLLDCGLLWSYETEHIFCKLFCFRFNFRFRTSGYKHPTARTRRRKC